MDPTDAELQAITDLPGVFTWAGVTGGLERSLRTVLGDPARVRELALVPRPAWDAMAQALKVPGPNDADGNPRDLTLVEKARVESARRVALLRMGVAPDTLDAEVTPLGQAEVQQFYQDYKTKFGDYPSPEADPSADQLASLRQVVSAGSAPYADFSLFGPHGLRLLRKQTFTSYTLNVATGEWSKKEQPGPASYHAWVEAWKVLRTALLLLEVADAERLDAYAEHVRSFVTQFGDSAWWLVYRAENRMRCEHMERIRRVLHDRPDHGYTAARPWNSAFAAAVKDGDFWTRELVTPATLWLSQRQPGSGSGGGTGSVPDRRPSGSGDGGGGDDEQAKKKARTGKKKYDGENLSEKKGGIFVKNRRGATICEGYNKGKCGSKKPQSKCKNSNSHQCNLCLGPHPATDCPKA